LYGSATMVVLSTGNGVNGFTLDPVNETYSFSLLENKCQSFFLQEVGEFILTHPNIKVKPRGKIFSINEGYSRTWDEATIEYVRSKKNPEVNYV